MWHVTWRMPWRTVYLVGLTGSSPPDRSHPHPHPHPRPHPHPHITLTLTLTLTPTLTNQVLTTDAATRKKFLGEIDNLLDDGFYATGSNM